MKPPATVRLPGASGRRLLAMAVALAAAFSLSLAAAPAPASATGATFSRLAGSDRYGTAATISTAQWWPHVPVAYVATGLNFPDALAAAPAAARDGGPVLLVDGGIPAATAAELSRVRPWRIVVVGSSGVVSDAVAMDLEAYDTGGGVSRLYGADRFETAVRISETFPSGVGTVYIATGHNFPDALAAAVPAGRDGGPVLLVEPDDVPDIVFWELQRLAPGRIIIAGGPGVVSENVANELRLITPNVGRLSGEDRYGTAAAVSAEHYSSGVPVVYVATGSNFPDALAGAVFAARTGGPILLTLQYGLPAATAYELSRLSPARVVMLGSSGVVGDGALTAMRNVLGVGGDFQYVPWGGTPAYQQQTNIWCVPASVQTMLHIANGNPGSDQATIYNFGRANMGYAIYADGLDPQAWEASLDYFGGGYVDYVDATYGSYDAALRSAIGSMRVTGRVAAITIDYGTHAWVIGGFLTSNDPTLTSDYQIRGVYILAPFVAWTDPPPGTYYSYIDLSYEMTPYYEPERWTHWNGTYVVIQPLR